MLRALSVVAILTLGACSAGEPTASRGPRNDPAAQFPTTSVPPEQPAPGDGDVSPPPIHVRSDGEELVLDPWSYCWTEGVMAVCADGSPPDPLPDAGSSDEIEIAFDAPGWHFTATAMATGQTCGRAQTVELEATGPTTHRLQPVGAAGDYEISLWGRGGPAAGDRGDVAATFRWRTPQDGADVAPSATVSIVGGDPAAPESFGVEMRVQNLRENPRTANATVEVSSGDNSLVIDLVRQRVECGPEGSLSFTAAEALGAQAARLGPPPFRYDVTLMLDSIAYGGAASWPEHEDPECAPCATLRFSPGLPGL